MVRQPAQAGAVAVDHVDLRVAIPVRGKRELRAVGRPRGQVILFLSRARHRVRAASLEDVRHDDVLKAGAIRRVGDRLPVGGPCGGDIQRAGHGHALLIRAVVVGHVDVRDAAVGDGARHPLAVPIRRERELRPRDAAQRTLLLVNLVGRRVRVQPRIPEASAVLLGHRGPAGGHVHQMHLHGDPGGGPAHGADHETICAKLFPLIERHLIDRRRSRNRPVRVARDEIELPLEIQIVPQHLADRLRGGNGFRVGAQGNEVGHRVFRWKSGRAVDRQDNLVGLPRRGWRLVLRAGQERSGGSNDGCDE